MRRKFQLALTLASVFAGTSATWAATNWTAPVTWLESETSAQDCIYFELSGVSTADPATPNNPWFAISRGQFGAADALATLLVAKTAGLSVNITTNSQIICGGYVQVTSVTLPP